MMFEIKREEKFIIF